MLPDSKEIELGSSDQEASPSAAKNTGVDILEVSGCHLLRQISSQRGSHKLFQGLVSHDLTAYLSIFNLF